MDNTAVHASHYAHSKGPRKMMKEANPGLLLLEHFVEDWHYPVFEGAVIGVRDEQVASAIHAALSELCAGPLVEVAEISRCEALNDVLLNAASRRDDYIHLQLIFQ